MHGSMGFFQLGIMGFSAVFFGGAAEWELHRKNWAKIQQTPLSSVYVKNTLIQPII